MCFGKVLGLVFPMPQLSDGKMALEVKRMTLLVHCICIVFFFLLLPASTCAQHQAGGFLFVCFVFLLNSLSLGPIYSRRRCRRAALTSCASGGPLYTNRCTLLPFVLVELCTNLKVLFCNHTAFCCLCTFPFTDTFWNPCNWLAYTRAT